MEINEAFLCVESSHVPFLKMFFPIENTTLAYQYAIRSKPLKAPYCLTFFDATPCKRIFNEAAGKYSRINLSDDNKEAFVRFGGDKAECGILLAGCVFDPDGKEPIQYFRTELYKVMVQYFMEAFKKASFAARSGVRILISDHSVNLTRSKKGKQYLSPVLFKQWEVVSIPTEIAKAIQEGAVERDLHVSCGW